MANLKVVILAGGLGTRLSEETEVKPKPMVEIGGRPILWHIFKHYSHFGYKDFVVALGYKGGMIKNWVLNYRLLESDITVSLKTGKITVRNPSPPPELPNEYSVGRGQPSPPRGEGVTREDWNVSLIDTGSKTMTGGRIGQMRAVLGKAPFMLTYGDGVCTVDLKKLLAFHRKMGRLATLTAVRPPSRFGGLVFNGDRVVQFSEKPQIGEGWINGGYMVIEPKVLDYIEGDDTVFERDVLERLAGEGQLAAYRHDGFWQCMDTMRDVRILEGLWSSGKAPWKIW